MSPRVRNIAVVLVSALALAVSGSVSAATGAHALPLRTVARVPLTGPSVRFDYTSLDSTTNELWISHMDASQLLAFDVRTRKIVKTIPAPGVHGVIAVPALGRVFASATDAHEVMTINAQTGAVLARASAGSYPDGLAYDPVARHVFISDESGGVETVLNARGARVATISLGGEAGNVQYDAGSGHVLVDVQTRGDIAIIDPRSNRIIRRLPLQGCASPHGLLIDSTRRLAFVACEANARLLTLDLRTMRVTGNASVGATPDVLAFDTTSTASTSRPRAASSRSSPSARTASQSLGRHFSRPKHIPSQSTHEPTSSTSPSRADRTASRSC